jgi:hypothetical protein
LRRIPDDFRQSIRSHFSTAFGYRDLQIQEHFLKQCIERNGALSFRFGLGRRGVLE